MPEDIVSQMNGSAASTEGSAAGSASGTDGSGNDRIVGFQRALADKDREIAEIRQMLEEQRLAGMSDDERETLLKQREADEVRRLREENARLKVLRETPEVADDLDRLFSAKTLREQAQIVAELKGAKPRAEMPNVPDVTRNNPPRQSSPNTWVDGMEMNDQLAEQIIRGGRR